MEPTIALFAFATFWFWTLVVLASIIIMVALEGEKGWLATLTIITALVVVHYWGGIRVVDYMKAHPIRVLGGIGAYFVAGAIWSIIKWWFYVRGNRRNCREALAAFEADWPGRISLETLPYGMRRDRLGEDDPIPSAEEILKKDKQDPEFKKKVWVACMAEGNYKEHHFEYKPDHHRHRNRILRWMTFWPWSFVWTMISDPIRRAFKMIYQRLAGVFTSISENAFKGMEVK